MLNFLDLYDFRVKTKELDLRKNESLKENKDPIGTIENYRKEKDILFKTHPQSALDEKQRSNFDGLKYFPYNQDLIFDAEIDLDFEENTLRFDNDIGEKMDLVKAGVVKFKVKDVDCKLSIFWMSIYGGGLILPFHDLTSPDMSYGSGRYLFDTIKDNSVIDFKKSEDKYKLKLDFNYAYNPSCAYNSIWVCPLAPKENFLNVEINAGELKYR